jgi:hypothetical protein
VCLCKFLDPLFPTMIDLLDTVTADLESGHLDDAEAIWGVALKTIRDVTRALCLMAQACAREERAHALEYLTRVQNPDLAHLHVEIAVAYRGVGVYRAAVRTAPRALVLGLNPSAPLSNACQRCFPWRQLLQRAGTQVPRKPNKDIDIGIEAGALTTLEQACRDRINGEIDGEPFSEAEMVFLGHDCLALNALDAQQSRKGRFWIGDVRTLLSPTARFKSGERAPANVQRATE